MKKSLLFAIWIAASFFGYSQIPRPNQHGPQLMVSAGISQTGINPSAFNSWTLNNYNKLEHVGAGFNLDMVVINNHYEYGFGAAITEPYATLSLYAGRRLTPENKIIGSYLNLVAGEFLAVYNNIPLTGYTPPPAARGHQIELHYADPFAGLQSRNYFNFLHFKTGKGKNAVSFNPGCMFNLSYMPWGGNWQYGYYTGSGKSEDFHGTRETGIPNLSKVFWGTGLFLGIGN
jgi:hypothetical protein